MLHRVKDLSPDQKHAAEILLGRPVLDDEAFSIRSLDPSRIVPARLSVAERLAALRSLEQRLARPLADADEEESAVPEALLAD